MWLSEEFLSMPKGTFEICDVSAPVSLFVLHQRTHIPKMKRLVTDVTSNPQGALWLWKNEPP